MQKPYQMSRIRGSSPSLVRRIGCGRSSLVLAAVHVLAAGLACAQTSLDAQLALAQEQADSPTIVEIATRLLQERPGNEDLTYTLAEAQINSDDLARAEATISKWLESKPNSSLALESRGDLFGAQEKSEEAIGAWTSALKGASKEHIAELYRKIAGAQFDLEQYKDSADSWKKAFETSNSAQDLMQRGDALVLDGRFDEAVVDAKKAGQLEPDNQTIKSSLPKFERLGESLPIINQLLHQPKSDLAGYIPARTRLAFILGASGFLDAGLIYAKEALEEKNAAFGPTVVAGFLYRSLGDIDDAADLKISGRMPAEAVLASVSRLIENMVADDATILLDKAAAPVWVRQLQRLRSLNEPWYGAVRGAEALKLYPGDAQILATQGWFLNAAAEPGATEMIEAALKKNPKLADAWLTKAAIARRAGDLTGTLQAYKKAVELGDASAAEEVRVLERILPRVATAQAAPAEKSKQKGQKGQ